MKITPGELYFVGEEDLIDGTLTPLVKIGLVREKEDRTSEERVREHQTGNPRRLRVLRVFASPVVDRVETLLQAEFAPRRIGGEWFHLPGAELDAAIQVAETRVNEATANAPALIAAHELERTESNGQALTPGTEIIEMHHRLLSVREQLAVTKKAEDQLEEALIETQHATPDGPRYVTEQPRSPSSYFDKAAFESTHPRIAGRYISEKTRLTQRFTVTPIKDHVPDLTADNPELGSHLSDVETAIAEGRGASVLHGHFLELLTLRSPLDWEKELLEAQLKASCQDHEKIAGICKWARTLVTKPALNVDKLKADRPDLYSRFIQQRPGTTAYIIAKDLGYRLPPG